MLNFSISPFIYYNNPELIESRNYIAFLFIWLLVPILHFLIQDSDMNQPVQHKEGKNQTQ